MLFPEDQIWMIVVGFIIAFILAFGIGANDVANSFGTSVGSKVLTLKQACILATVCEMAGAVLLGAKVSNTIRKGIVDTDMFTELANGPAVLMAGQVAALAGSCIWLLVATFFRLPVSGTHSIVGATVGFSLVVFGFQSIRWIGLVKIVASWFLSPVLSGLSSVGMFYLMKFLVFNKESHLEPALKLLPGFYGTVVLVNVFSIFYEGPPMLHFDKIPLYGVFILSCGCGVIAVLCVHFFLVPRLRRRVFARQNPKPTVTEEINSMEIRRFMILPRKSDKLSSSLEETSTMASIGAERTTSDQLEMAIREDQAEAIVQSSSDQAAVNNLNLDHKPNKSNSNRFRRKKRSPKIEQTAGERKPGEELSEANGTHESEATSDPTRDISGRINGKLANESPFEVVKVTIKDQPEEILSADPDSAEISRRRLVEGEVFSFLQIITAVFGSFAHGGNDVSNAIGPLIGLWIVGVTQSVDSKMPTPIWILVYGGVGISIGLWIWGRRVIQTIGEDLTQITPSNGVCIEIGAAVTVLVASKAGLPISTTHCKVGSVVGVGRARSRESVNWSVFRNILIAWLVTLPVSGAISALLMFAFSFAV